MGKYLIILLFSTSFCFSQNHLEGIILDSEDKQPIEFVSIYNAKDNTMSNGDGKFLFSTKLDSVYFYILGYEKLSATISQLKDTIYLTKSLFELDEVVVTNAKTIYQKIKDSVPSNYLLTPHSEKFVLRAILKRNDTIIRIQDMQGKLRRKTSIYGGGLDLEKKDFQVELTNMRKVGIVRDKEDIYFNFPSFHRIFSEFVRINAMGTDFEVIEKPFKKGDNIRVEFNSPASEPIRNEWGHYSINSENNAILLVNLNFKPNYPEFKITDKLQSRLASYKLQVFFKKDNETGKYYLSSARRDEVFEVVGSVEKPFRTKYESNFILSTSVSLGDFKVRSNVNEHKDIFKIKHSYDEAYWNSQNQLLLTDEMKTFIEKMGKKNTEFKVKSNIKY